MFCNIYIYVYIVIIEINESERLSWTPWQSDVDPTLRITALEDWTMPLEFMAKPKLRSTGVILEVLNIRESSVWKVSLEEVYLDSE